MRNNDYAFDRNLIIIYKKNFSISKQILASIHLCNERTRRRLNNSGSRNEWSGSDAACNSTFSHRQPSEHTFKFLPATRAYSRLIFRIQFYNPFV